MQVKVPNLSWRDGRPRWNPGPHARALGFRGCDLKDQAGAWLDLPSAVARAQALNAALSAARLGRQPEPVVMRPAAHDAVALFARWQGSPEFRLLAPKTQSDYVNKGHIFLERFGRFDVADLSRAMLKQFWRELFDTRGHHQANGVLAVVRAALTYAVDDEWIEVNPATALRLPQPAARLVLWTPEEVLAGVAAADREGLPSVGDAIVLALHSGQRQGDVLKLPLRILDRRQLLLSQAKRGARIDAPMTPALLARMTAARERVAGGAVVHVNGPIVRYEGTGQAYAVDLFRKKFAIVRAAAAEQVPSIAGKTFQDLRDTAVTRLALAGCTVPQICAITGHSLRTAHDVLRAYLALDSRMAAEAIGLLVQYMEREGIAL